MVAIEYDSSEKDLLIKIGGDNFRDLVDFLKEEGCRWNPELKRWTLNVTKYEDFYKSCVNFGEQPEVDLLTEEEIKHYYENLKELKVYRRTYRQELMNNPPLVGKHPYESYQIQDLLRGLCQNRFLYHHEMGLGKSWILTGLIEHKRYYGDLNKCLIFSSSIGTRNVKGELMLHGKNMKDEDILTITSMAKVKFEDRDIFNTEKYPQTIIILSYDALKSISNYYYDIKYGTKKNKHPSTSKAYLKNPMPIEEWLGGKAGGLFLDENHYLSSPTSRRTKIMNFIVPYFDQRFEFTGTLADKYEKLYEPSKILDPALVDGMDYQTWCAKYNDIGNSYSPYAINPNGWRLDLIEEFNKKMLKYYCAKRLMVDCLDLPLNYEVPTMFMEMSPLHRKIYERFSNFTAAEQANIASEGGQSFSERMKNLFQYFQTCVDNPTALKNNKKFQYFPQDLQDDINKFDYNKDYNKIKLVDEIIEERTDVDDQKGIIWYFHPETMVALKERYKKYNPCIISADVPMDDRIPLVKKFLKDPKQKLLIASIKVMNTSVTCVECKYEVYVEKTYNFVEYTQSRGRIFRPGQTEVTRTYSLRYDNSIDNLQELNLETKGETLNSLFNQKYISEGIWKKLFSLQKGQTI